MTWIEDEGGNIVQSALSGRVKPKEITKQTITEGKAEEVIMLVIPPTGGEYVKC
jgi:hypothetical protein